jgi:Flp pilus assembly protein TadD
MTRSDRQPPSAGVVPLGVPARIAHLFAEALRCQQTGRAAEAEQLCRQILAIDPRYADAFHLLGGMAHQAGRSEAAVGLIEQAIALKSGVPAYHNSLGMALRAQGTPERAEAQYRHALALQPDFIHAHNNLGLLLQTEGRLDDAAACFRRALAVDPGFAIAHHNLGVVLRLEGRLDEAFAAYRRYAALRLAQPQAAARGLAPELDAIKRRHDREQLDYLIAAHPEDTRWHQLGAAADAAPERFPALFEALFHLDHGARIEPVAVNPALDAAALEAAWSERQPQVLVIDDFLTAAALDELRRFCWGSTVWRAPYANGYLGAFFGDGFACPLLAQIAGELAAKLPGVIRRYPLVQLWGFKYDSALRGINIHADIAAVNVNFWITADEANLEPHSGGLVIWDAPAPLDWSFEKYQANDAREIRAFLAARNARATTVHYRCNRAVVFDSDLFHETDRFAFAEGYCNRRINVTMLYGLRHQADADRGG